MADEDIPDIEEAAASWHARRACGTDARDERAFREWRAADPGHGPAYDRIATRHDGIIALADAPEILALRHQTLARLAVARRARQRRRAAVVATLAVALAATPLVLLRPGGGPSPVALAGAAAERGRGQTFRTATGQRLTLALGDGSRVTLNTASRLRVTYTPDARELALDEGQAWFEVARDKARPFLVHAGGRRVEAHGTAFDVRILPGRTEVMLAEGRVTVDADRPGAAGTGVALQPNQLLVATATGTTVGRVADPAAWADWRRGVVRFDNVPLARAVEEMNRYSETRLVVGDAETGRIAISGGFGAGRTDAFVEALAAGFGIGSRRDGEGRIVLRLIR